MVRKVSADALPIRAVKALTSPTVLKNLVIDIARLQRADRTAGARLRALGEELRELERRPPDEKGVRERLREVRQEIREFEARRRADAAMLKRKLEQLEAVQKGHAPESVDEDEGLRPAEPETDRPYVRPFTPDLSSLNERER